MITFSEMTSSGSFKRANNFSSVWYEFHLHARNNSVRADVVFFKWCACHWSKSLQIQIRIRSRNQTSIDVCAHFAKLFVLVVMNCLSSDGAVFFLTGLHVHTRSYISRSHYSAMLSRCSSVCTTSYTSEQRLLKQTNTSGCNCKLLWW